MQTCFSLDPFLPRTAPQFLDRRPGDLTVLQLSWVLQTPVNLSVSSKHLSVDFYELCRLNGSGTLESGAVWPEDTEMKQGMKRTWLSTSGTIGRLGFALEGAAFGLSLPGDGSSS